MLNAVWCALCSYARTATACDGAEYMVAAVSFVLFHGLVFVEWRKPAKMNFNENMCHLHCNNPFIYSNIKTLWPWIKAYRGECTWKIYKPLEMRQILFMFCISDVQKSIFDAMNVNAWPDDLLKEASCIQRSCLHQNLFRSRIQTTFMEERNNFQERKERKFMKPKISAKYRKAVLWTVKSSNSLSDEVRIKAYLFHCD